MNTSEDGTPVFTAADCRHMARALRLAARGLYTTHPNPRVGCVIARDGHAIAEGWHERAGGPHAEVVALETAGAAARGATAYVTLEPCCHHGRTPPCSARLVEAGVARVVAAGEDTNPRVNGSGIAALRRAGIRVDVGLMAAEAGALNAGFLRRAAGGLPWVRVKLGASLDGRTAMASGESRWITGDAARRDVHRWRARSAAIVTGAGTLRADDPALTVRLAGVSSRPLRVVMASSAGDLPAGARLLQGDGDVLVATLRAGPPRRGVEQLELPAGPGGVDPRALLAGLARREINEVLVEAGPTLAGTFVQAGLVDEYIVYLAPRFLGAGARGMFTLPGLDTLGQRVELEITDLRRFGEDIRILARPRGAP